MLASIRMLSRIRQLGILERGHSVAKAVLPSCSNGRHGRAWRRSCCGKTRRQQRGLRSSRRPSAAFRSSWCLSCRCAPHVRLPSETFPQICAGHIPCTAAHLVAKCAQCMMCREVKDAACPNPSLNLSPRSVSRDVSLQLRLSLPHGKHMTAGSCPAGLHSSVTAVCRARGRNWRRRNRGAARVAGGSGLAGAAAGAACVRARCGLRRPDGEGGGRGSRGAAARC